MIRISDTRSVYSACIKRDGDEFFDFLTVAAHDVNSILKIVMKRMFNLREIVSLMPGSASLTSCTAKTERAVFGIDDLANSIFIALVESIFRMSLISLIYCLVRKRRNEYLKSLVFALVIMKFDVAANLIHDPMDNKMSHRLPVEVHRWSTFDAEGRLVYVHRMYQM